MPKKQINKTKSQKILPDHLPIEGMGREEMMELYSWNFDDAMAAQEAWEQTEDYQRGPFFRWIGAQALKEMYEDFKAGNNTVIMEAFYLCSLNSLPIPRWCELAFLSAYRQVYQYKAKSWDEVFGRPHPKGIHLGAKREEYEKSLPIYHRIEKIKRRWPSIPIDEYLFEKVGQKFGAKKTKTAEWYYKWKNKIHNFDK